MKKIWCLNSVVFFSAFLLFQIELIISKTLLFKFGGGYTVWGAALVFFQGTLLLGYLYSHFVIQKLGISRYRYFHLGLLFLTLLFFPGRPLPAISSQYQIPMVINIFWQLMRSIGLAFFFLSTISIIFQSWLAESELAENRNPYALYAVSNLGSFAGLLTYPVFFEALFGLATQLNTWRIIYFVVFGLNLVVFKLISVRDEDKETTPRLNEIDVKQKVYWFLLSSVGVIMLLSVTNIITYEITPVPLLWVIPLCIYLISFVLNFKKSPWCPAWIKEKFYVTTAFGIILFFWTQRRILPVTLEFIFLCAVLFIVCMFCQSELNRAKPADSHNLTIFYLMISTGGFVGGFLVSWIIPLVSAPTIEYLLGLFFVYCALIINEKKIEINFYIIRLIVYLIVFLILWPMVFKVYSVFGIIVMAVIFKSVYSEFKTKPFAIGLSLFFILCLSSLLDLMWASQIYIYKHRNYYGIYEIYDKRGKRILLNGTTIHGAQYLIEKKEMEPLTYYNRATPVGQVITSELFNFKRIGVIGLGAGTLAAYGNAERVIDFFELDPDVFRIANKYFTYLKKSSAKINYVFGDARVSMLKTPNKTYNLLVVDAFSGDSVPVHLLTTEAITEYFRCVSDEGIVLFHISNRYVDLAPVLFSNAKVLNLYACIDSNPKSKDNDDAFASVWVAFTREANVFEKLTSQLKWHKHDSKRPIRYIRPWTDQYSNVLTVLRVNIFLSQIKEFQPFYW